MERWKLGERRKLGEVELRMLGGGVGEVALVCWAGSLRDVMGTALIGRRCERKERRIMRCRESIMRCAQGLEKSALQRMRDI